MDSFDDSLLRALPYPAVVGHDGRVFRYNGPALKLFPELIDRDDLPDTLLPATGAASGLVFTGDGAWRLSVSSLDEYKLYLLCPADLTGIPQAMLDGTMRRLHEQLSCLVLGVQAMQSCMRADAAPDSVAQVNRSLCQMLRLTENIDLLQEMDSDTYLFRPVALDIGGLCGDVCRVSNDLLEHISTCVTYHPPRYPMLVKGDIPLLRRLLVELLSNACKAAGEDSELTLRVEHHGDRAVLTLSGREMDGLARPLAAILSGKRAANELPMPGDGAGLGLLLVQRAVSLHQGTLMMERQKDRVCCTLSLPLAPRGTGLSFHSPTFQRNTGFCPELVALSDLLPWQAFVHTVLE